MKEEENFHNCVKFIPKKTGACLIWPRHWLITQNAWVAVMLMVSADYGEKWLKKAFSIESRLLILK